MLSFLFLGGATRCSWNRLRVPGHGHGRGRGGCVERGTVLGAQELQSSRRQDSASVRKSHAASTSEYREFPPLLDGYTQRQTTCNYIYLYLQCDR